MRSGKYLIVCLLLVLMTGFMPVSSFAYFENGHLILSVYNENDLEIGIDLGVAADILTITATNFELAPSGMISLDKFGDNVEGWSDLSAGAWGGISTLYKIYVGITDTLSPPVQIPSISNFMNGVLMTSTEYRKTNNGEQYDVITSSNQNSYDMRLNSNSNAPGTFGDININGSNNKSEANLGVLDTVGYVDLHLFAYDAITNMAGLSGGAEPNALIRIMADGSVILNPYVAPQVNTLTITASANPTALDEGSSTQVQLIGSAMDTLGDALEYSWAQTEGPIVTLSGAGDAATRSFTAPNVGYGGAILTFQLTVTDLHSNSNTSDPVTVTVNFVNQVPLANAGPDLYLDRDTSPDTITLQGSAHDPDGGDTITIAWAQVSGNPVTLSSSNTATPSFSLAEVSSSDSSLEFRISVTDLSGAVTTDTMIVSLTSPPTAQAQASPNNVDEVHGSTVPVTLVGSGSTDPEGDIVSYVWAYSGSLSLTVSNDDTTRPDRVIQIPEVGFGGAQLEFILTVTDSSGNTDSDTLTITVNNMNREPELVIVSPGTVIEGNEFTLDATGSSDPDGPAATEFSSIVWTQLNETPANHAERLDNEVALAPRYRAPSLEYGDNLTLEFELSVTDTSGSTKTAPVSVPVTYGNHIPTAPSINAPRYTGGIYSSDNGEVNTLTPTLSVNNASDGDGQTLTYHFQLAANSSMTSILAERSGITQGTSITSWNISAEDFLISGHSLDDETIYYFRASATDGLSLSNEILWSQTAAFFVNLANDAPTLPGVIYPPDNTVIRTLTPWFCLSNATDQDHDTLVYDFRIYSFENGIQGDLLVSTGEQPIAQGNVAVDDEGNPLSTPAQGETSWKPSIILTDNSTYLWKVRAMDINLGEVSVERDWKTLTFTINTEDDTPSSPVVYHPVNGSEVDVQTPTLTVTNAQDNDPNDILTYYFEVTSKGSATSCEERFINCDETNLCTVFQSGSVAEGAVDNELPGDPGWTDVADEGSSSGDWEIPFSSTTTSWTLPSNEPGLPLSDNTYYCWRAQAQDSSDQVSEWTYSRFFVNRSNDAPEAPDIETPQNGSTVIHSSDPANTKIALKIHDAFDMDHDNLTYRFELFNNDNPENSVAILTKTSNETTWEISKQSLTHGQTYYWRVRASDAHTDGPWSMLASFRYFQEYPPVPIINSPAHGSVVNSLTPTLSVLNSQSTEQDDITYEFELYASSAMNATSYVARAAIPQGAPVTQWKLSSPATQWSNSYPAHTLFNRTNYYWKVKATIGSLKSSWTNTSRFSVNLDAQVLDVTVVTSQAVLGASLTEQILPVNDVTGPLNGISLTIPAGEISENATLIIGYVTNPSTLPSNLVSLYPVMEFLPSGLTFTHGIQLTLPWNINDLPSGVLETATAVGLYYYNTDSNTWDLVQEIPIASITGDTLTFTLSHFSSYAVGVSTSGLGSSDDTPDSGSSSDDSSNSGCFIGSSRM
ncbi:MAG: hypothetical protein KKD44_25635 [Proteobacteria bacterium]|nr:hypothetical protein [Pseudomonadota bacterium]